MQSAPLWRATAVGVRNMMLPNHQPLPLVCENEWNCLQITGLFAPSVHSNCWIGIVCSTLGSDDHLEPIFLPSWFVDQLCSSLLVHQVCDRNLRCNLASSCHNRRFFAPFSVGDSPHLPMEYVETARCLSQGFKPWHTHNDQINQI